MREALNLRCAISRIKTKGDIVGELAGYTKETVSRGSEAVKGSRAVTDQRMGQKGGAVHAWGQQAKPGVWDKAAPPISVE